MTHNIQLTAIAALISVSGVSHAALTTSSGPVSFSGSASVTASGTSVLSASNSNNGASIASVALGQFDSATGVLTGVDLSLASNRTQTLSGTGYKNNGAGKTMSGSGTSTGALAAAGINLGLTPAISQAGGSCSLAMGMTGYISCGWGPNTSTSATNASASVDSGSLDAYVGNGTVNAALSLPTLSSTTTQTSTMGQTSGSTATYSVDWTGSLQANYSYLLHALASFDGSSASNSLTLDFGTVAQNSLASMSFNLFNLADANRIGLDLDSVAGNGDTGAFSTGLSNFADLAQGQSLAFVASLLSDQVGSFSAQYLLNLSDADFGASNTRQNYQLTLNLVGNVAAVPVPGAVWLFGSAVLGMLGVSRRKPGARALPLTA